MPAAISQSLSLSAPVTGDQGEQGELGEQGGAGQVRSLNIKHIISQISNLQFKWSLQQHYLLILPGYQTSDSASSSNFHHFQNQNQAGVC